MHFLLTETQRRVYTHDVTKRKETQMVNKKMFLYHVALRDTTCREVAKEIEVHPVTLSHKLNGKSDFTLEEMRSIRKALGLSDQEMAEVFRFDD